MIVNIIAFIWYFLLAYCAVLSICFTLYGIFGGLIIRNIHGYARVARLNETFNIQKVKKDIKQLKKDVDSETFWVNIAQNSSNLALLLPEEGHNFSNKSFYENAIMYAAYKYNVFIGSYDDGSMTTLKLALFNDKWETSFRNYILCYTHAIEKVDFGFYKKYSAFINEFLDEIVGEVGGHNYL